MRRAWRLVARGCLWLGATTALPSEPETKPILHEALGHPVRISHEALDARSEEGGHSIPLILIGPPEIDRREIELVDRDQLVPAEPYSSQVVHKLRGVTHHHHR